LTREVRTRLKTIRGQVDGLIRLLEQDSDPEKVLQQFKAVQKGFDKSHHLLLDEALRKTLALKISETIRKCPGNCGQQDRIEFVRQQFPHLQPNELTVKLREMRQIEQRMAEWK